MLQLVLKCVFFFQQEGAFAGPLVQVIIRVLLHILVHKKVLVVLVITLGWRRHPVASLLLVRASLQPLVVNSEFHNLLNSDDRLHYATCHDLTDYEK